MVESGWFRPPPLATDRSMAGRALILIDLQNEFLAPGGNFPIDAGSKASLIQTLNTLVPAFRSAGGQIIWIRSEYAKIDQTRQGTPAPASGNDENGGADADWAWLVEGTHMGKRACCQEGLFGAQLAPFVSKLFRKEDTSIIKHWYSSFKETTLEEHLTSQNISHIYLGGVLSNCCVLATALWAANRCPNLAPHFMKDAVGWRKESSHLRGIETLVKESIPVVDTSQVLALAPVASPSSPSATQAPTPVQLVKPPPGPESPRYGQIDTYLVEDMLPANIAKDAFDDLRQEAD
jgi:nicotinamidase-related amidase